MRTRTPATVAAAVVVLLAVSMLATMRGADAGAPLPPPAAAPLVIADAALAGEHAAAGITVTAGWEPGGLLGVDPWTAVDPRDGVRPWIDLLPRTRIAYDPAGRMLVEDAVVIADPARCYHLARIVRRVGVGLAPPVGPDIATQIESWLEPPYFSGVRVPSGTAPCTGTDRSRWGFAIEQAEPVACEVPGREVLCVTLAKWRYDFGSRDVWTATHRAFDVVDGARLDDADLHPDLDVAALDALLVDVLCAAGGRCDGVPPREGRILPAREALVIELSPGEGADAIHGALQVSVPRTSLPLRSR